MPNTTSKSWSSKSKRTRSGRGAQTIRDSSGDEDYVRIAVKYLLEALKEHEDIMRRYG